MIGFGIFFCDHLCKIELNYAIYYKKEFADEYTKELSDVFDFEYTVKKVRIEVEENE